MKKMFLVFLCLIASICSAQPSHYGPYDPGAIRSDGTNASDTVTLNRVRTATGTAAAPAYSFSTDPDTGIYSPGANTIGFGVGGADVASLSSTGLSLGTPLSVASRVTAGNHVINTDGYVRSAGVFVYSDNIGSIASGAARYIDFSLGASGGFTSEVLTNMQFSVSKQAGGVWYSTAAYNATTGLSGLTTLQTVDLDDSQLLTVTWSQPAANTLRLTLTNTHTSTLYAVSVSVKVTSDRASFMAFKAKG